MVMDPHVRFVNEYSCFSLFRDTIYIAFIAIMKGKTI